MKKPKEVRSKTSEIKQTERIEQTIAEKKFNRCEFCKEEFSINHLTRCNSVSICENCLKDYCEYCKEIKPFITVRKDFNNKEHTFKQLCSDCYLKLCDIIYIMDKNYGINNLNKNNLGDTNEDI